MGKGKVVGFGLLVLLLVVIPLLVACPPKPAPVPVAPVPVPGVFKGTIKIHQAPCLTGPWAAVVGPCFKGSELYRKYVNERGGLEGYYVETVWADSAYMVARTLSIYKRYREEVPKPIVHGYLWLP